MKAQTFRLREKAEVLAIQVKATDASVNDVATFLGKNFTGATIDKEEKTASVYFNEELDNRETVAYDGEYVLKLQKNKFQVLSKYQFEEKYVRVK